jgi:hypothetical protein
MYLSASSGVGKVFIVVVFVVAIAAYISRIDTEKQKLGIDVMSAIVFKGGVTGISFCPSICIFDLINNICCSRNFNSGIRGYSHRRQQSANTQGKAK